MIREGRTQGSGLRVLLLLLMPWRAVALWLFLLLVLHVSLLAFLQFLLLLSVLLLHLPQLLLLATLELLLLPLIRPLPFQFLLLLDVPLLGREEGGRSSNVRPLFAGGFPGRFVSLEFSRGRFGAIGLPVSAAPRRLNWPGRGVAATSGRP